MNRRGFLGSILAACAAPAIVKAESIMRVRPLILPGDDEWAYVGSMSPMQAVMALRGGGLLQLRNASDQLLAEIPLPEFLPAHGGGIATKDCAQGPVQRTGAYTHSRIVDRDGRVIVDLGDQFRLDNGSLLAGSVIMAWPMTLNLE